MRAPRIHFKPTWRRWFVAVLAAVLVAGSAQASGRSAILEAIHKLENPRNLLRPGPRGELGAYQFRVGTWRMHTDLPFERALDRSLSDLVAVRHYEWIKRGLENARMPVTSYNVALAWNGGLTAAISGKSPRRAHDYAQRAANLAATMTPPRLIADTR